MYEGSNFSTFSTVVTVFSILLIIVTLLGCKVYLVTVLICIFLMTNDNEYLFMCLLAICISSMGKYLFQVFCPFVNRTDFLLLDSNSFLKYVLDTSSLSDIWFTIIFSHSMGCLVALLMVSLEAQDFNFNEFQFFYFSLLPFVLSVSFLKRIHLTQDMNTYSYVSSQFSSVQSLSCVQLFVTPWTTAHQASLPITNSRSPPKPMSIKSVTPSNHLILCRPLLLLPSIFPSIRVLSNELALHIRWSK